MQMATGGSWAPSFCSCSEDSGLGWVTATPALRASCCLVQEHLLGSNHVMWDPRCLRKGARARLEWRWLPPCSGKPPPYFQQLVGDGSAVQVSRWAVPAAVGGPAVPSEWHVPMAGTSPSASSASVRHSVPLSLLSSGQRHLGDPDVQPADAERAGEQGNQPHAVQPPVPQEPGPSQFPQPALVLQPSPQ